MDDCNAWAEPKGFVFQHILRIVMQTQLRWTLTLKALRLVSRAWRDGVSHAVPLLAPKPAACTTDLVLLPRVFCGAKVLRLQSPTCDGPSADDLLLAIGEGLPSLSALLAFNLSATAHGAAALHRLSSIRWLELDAPGNTCAAAVEVLAACTSLQRLRLLPTSGGSEPELTHKTLASVSRLTGLHSLECSARRAGAAQLAAALGTLPALTRLRLEDMALDGAPALAELAPRLGQLAFSLDYGPSPGLLAAMEPPAGDDAAATSFLGLPGLLPLSRLGGLRALGAPWELFAESSQLRCLSGLTSVSVDFHAETQGDDAPGCDAACVRLVKALPALRHLRLAGARSEVSAVALAVGLAAAPSLTSLTSLELEGMYEVDSQVLGAVGRLRGLRRLMLEATSFDGEGLAELLGTLGPLGMLTRLELINSAGVMATQELAGALAEVRSLRHLHLRGHPYVGRAALERILVSLAPSLELLQTTWKPEASSQEDAAFCQRWQHVLQHSMNVVGGDAVKMDGLPCVS